MLSRVADSLYWLSRYIERAGTHRPPGRGQAGFDGGADAGRRLRQLGAGDRGADRRKRSRRFSTWTPLPSPARWRSTRDNDNSLVTSLGLARDNARQVREALSNEMWESLNRLYLRLAR